MSNREWIVGRTFEVIELLTPASRWEVTRRNSLYLMFRDAASPVDEPASEQERQLRDAARIILLQIGVTGSAPSPNLQADELDEVEMDSVWRDGAIAPMSIRGLVMTLIGRMLTADTKQAISDLLLRSRDVAADDRQANYELIKAVTDNDNPQFDLCLPNLTVTINPRAPQRAITSAINTIVREYRQEHRIEEQRRRADKTDEYLAVWDAREGWNGAGYDCRREQRFREIARQTSTSIPTLFNRYKAAFKLIIGHDYTPELWSRTVGIPKLAGLLGQGLPRITRSRPANTRRPREVSSSVLSPSNETSHGDFLQTAGCDSSDLEQFELLSDIETLILAGRSNEDIVGELGMSESPESIELIAYFRDRLADSGAIDA